MKLYLLVGLIICVLRCVEAGTQSETAICDLNCICKEVKKKYSTEFVVNCNGTNAEEFILTENLFPVEEKPKRRRKLHVGIKNYLSLRIEASFLKRWLAYDSCSLDIKNCIAVQFPTTPITTDVDIKSTKFAGIGISLSNINQLTPDIFSKKKGAEIRLHNSKADSLNVGGLNAEKLYYLEIKNSTIIQLKGSQNKIILGKHTRYPSERKIDIQDSHIGVFNKHSFNIDTDIPHAEITVQTTTIGYLETEAISLGKRMSLNINTSSIGFVPPSSINVDEEANLRMVDNVLGLEPASIRHLECMDGRITIANNQVFPIKSFENCSLSIIPVEGSSYADCSSMATSQTEFIHETCKENNILFFSVNANSKNVPKSTTDPSPHVTTIEDMDLPDQTTLTTIEDMDLADQTTLTTIINISSILPSDTKRNVSELRMFLTFTESNVIMNKGLLYLIIGLFSTLVLIIIILLWFVVFGKQSERKGSLKKREYDQLNTDQSTYVPSERYIFDIDSPQ